MGVWIEIEFSPAMIDDFTVTPLVGVWIEIARTLQFGTSDPVTPLVGVWIEIIFASAGMKGDACHSPCGSVD